MTQDEAIDAERARQLLEDPLLAHIFADEAGAAMRELLDTTGIGEEYDAKRRELIARINVINGTKDRLKMKVVVGQQAARPRLGIA